MRVRILTSIATPSTAYRRGQIVPDLDDSTALEWIARGIAAEVEAGPVVETAEAPRYETSAAPPRGRKGRRA